MEGRIRGYAALRDQGEGYHGDIYGLILLLDLAELVSSNEVSQKSQYGGSTVAWRTHMSIRSPCLPFCHSCFDILLLVSPYLDPVLSCLYFLRGDQVALTFISGNARRNFVLFTRTWRCDGHACCTTWSFQ